MVYFSRSKVIRMNWYLAAESKVLDDPADATVAVVAGADDVADAVDDVQTDAIDDGLSELAGAVKALPTCKTIEPNLF